MSVHKYSTSPGSNSFVGDGSGVVGVQEGMPRGNVNDAMRAMMSDIAKFFRDQGTIVTAGTSSTYTVTANGDYTSYAAGMHMVVRFHTSCAANATLNVNALGAKALRMRQDNALVNVMANAILGGAAYEIVCDGTNLIVVGLVDYPKIKADIQALFDTFNGDALGFDSVSASTGFYVTGGSLTTGGHLNGVDLGLTGGATILGSLTANIDITCGNELETKYFLMDTPGGYFNIANNGQFDGTVTINGSLVKGGLSYWHPSNDGPASGLDADLLDSQQGSYYTDIPARLGYTPVRQGGSSAINMYWDVSSNLGVVVDVTWVGWLVRSSVSGSVAGDIANHAVGAVGSYALLSYVPGADVNPGVIAAGNDLRYSNAYGSNTGGTPTGSWRCMGWASNAQGLEGKTTLWLRVA